MFQRILFCCHKVFYHQLNAWIVHGQLVDICEEFFIHKIDLAAGSGQGKGVANVQQSVLESEAPPKSEMNVTKFSKGGMSVTGKNIFENIVQTAADNFGASDDAANLGSGTDSINQEWNVSYTLRISMLPHCYIGYTLANKILFIGKAIRVLQSKRTRQEDRIPLEELQAFSEAIMKLSKLSQFNVILFSKIVEEIRECVASRLWHLVVVKADLISHLKSIKDYFLLAKGEFYQTFLEDARQIMTLPPTTSAHDDLSLGPLQTTISKLRLEDDAIFTRKFKLTLRNFFFVYRDFTRLPGLIYDGDIRFDQVNNCLRITSTKNSSKSGCLWHSLKQRIDLGFKTSFGFRFMNPLGMQKGGVNASMLSGSQAGTPRHARDSFVPPKLGMQPGDEVLGGDRQVIDCAVAFIIQNEKEVIPWKMKTPVSTQDLNQFIAVKFITKITVEREKF